MNTQKLREDLQQSLNGRERFWVFMLFPFTILLSIVGVILHKIGIWGAIWYFRMLAMSYSEDISNGKSRG